MSKNTGLWMIGVVSVLMILYGGFLLSNKISEQNKQYLEDHKWDLGETRNGVTLISIKDGFRFSAVFSYEGKNYQMYSGDSLVFPNGLMIRLLRSYPQRGYVTVEGS